uniref:NACHT LRR and PYD domain-containing protein n=1 Tax=Scleropages formosus TaxID=113540 RepID=A0A8C9QXZ9_SCLFO
MNLSAEKAIYLFQCLNELNDNSLVKQVQKYLKTGNLSEKEISPAQWSALAFVLMMSAEEMDELDLRNYTLYYEGLQRMLPVIQVSRTALLISCSLTKSSCGALVSILNLDSNLRVLDLSDNDLQDSGVELLSAGLGNQQCKLETLRLSGCCVTEGGCTSLASALCSNPSSHLRELDLSYNHPGNSGVKLLSDLQQDPTYKLETLHLSNCGVTEGGCASLASALCSNPCSHLRELDLSYNHPGDSGVTLLSDLLLDPTCKLETLRLKMCGLTKKCCGALASALCSNPSHLRELDLSENDLQDSGVELLSAGLGNKHCKLDTLILSGCCVTEGGCTSLASALCLNPCSDLRELDLSYNHPGESGEKLLSDLLHDPTCKLETLRWV